MTDETILALSILRATYEGRTEDAEYLAESAGAQEVVDGLISLAARLLTSLATVKNVSNEDLFNQYQEVLLKEAVQ